MTEAMVTARSVRNDIRSLSAQKIEPMKKNGMIDTEGTTLVSRTMIGGPW